MAPNVCATELRVEARLCFRRPAAHQDFAWIVASRDPRNGNPKRQRGIQTSLTLFEVAVFIPQRGFTPKPEVTDSSVSPSAELGIDGAKDASVRCPRSVPSLAQLSSDRSAIVLDRVPLTRS